MRDNENPNLKKGNNSHIQTRNQSPLRRQEEQSQIMNEQLIYDYKKKLRKLTRGLNGQFDNKPVFWKYNVINHRREKADIITKWREKNFEAPIYSKVSMLDVKEILKRKKRQSSPIKQSIKNNIDRRVKLGFLAKGAANPL